MHVFQIKLEPRGSRAGFNKLKKTLQKILRSYADSSKKTRQFVLSFCYYYINTVRTQPIAGRRDVKYFKAFVQVLLLF